MPRRDFTVPLREANVRVYSPKRSLGYRFGKYIARYPRLKESFDQAYLRNRMELFFFEANVKRVVAWNALPIDAFVPKGGDIILYDHGMSSKQNPHSLNRERVQKARSIIAISRANQRLMEERLGLGWRNPCPP